MFTAYSFRSKLWYNIYIICTVLIMSYSAFQLYGLYLMHSFGMFWESFDFLQGQNREHFKRSVVHMTKSP